MNKSFLFIGLAVTIALVAIFGGCKQDNPAEPLEPVSLVLPDSAVVQHFAGDSVPIELKFTTDRPINWVLLLSATDTSGLANNIPALYPDTLYYRTWNSNPDSPRINLYTYTGLYRIPNSLKSFSVIYFDASFQAGSTSFATGQNYPAGIVTGDKKFKVSVL